MARQSSFDLLNEIKPDSPKDFIEAAICALKENKKLHTQFIDVYKRLLAPHQLSHQFFTRTEPDASYKDVVLKSVDLLHQQLNGLVGKKISDMTLKELTLIYNNYYYKQQAEFKNMHDEHSFIHSAIPGNSTEERIHAIALNILKSESNGYILLHVLGNNSREGVNIMWALYRELIVQSNEFYRYNFAKLPEFISRIVFVNSSAGGKATEMNRVDGFAIQNIKHLLSPQPEGAAANDALTLQDGTYTFHQAHNINLSQFGNPDSVTVKISTQSNKQYAMITDNTGKILYKKIAVYHSDNGLFFGIPESHVNEADVRLRLKSKLFDMQLREIFNDNKMLIDCCKQPLILREDRSTNTGTNYQSVSDVVLNNLHKKNKDFVANDIWISTQREQQGARASCPNQLKHGFYKAFYINPDTAADAEHLSEKHLLMALFNALKEFLNHINYDIQKKMYSHPLCIDPDTSTLYTKFLTELLRSQKIIPQNKETYTHKECLDFVNNIWGQLELHVPQKDTSHGMALMLTHEAQLARYARLWKEKKAAKDLSDKTPQPSQKTAG